MISTVINKLTDEHFTVVDENGNLVSSINSSEFTVYIYNPYGVNVTGSIVSGFIDLGDGNYRFSFIPNQVGSWYINITHPVYFPWGKNDDVFVYEADISMVYESVKKTLGLVHHNLLIDDPVYGEHGSLVSARVRIYEDASQVGSEDGIIETYRIEADESGMGKFSYWKQVVI